MNLAFTTTISLRHQIVVLISPKPELKSTRMSLADWKNQSSSELPVRLSATDESLLIVELLSLVAPFKPPPLRRFATRDE